VCVCVYKYVVGVCDLGVLMLTRAHN